MAKALVCNLCAASGKAVFATVHAEGRVGIGKGAREFDADFCEEHGQTFVDLVGRRTRAEYKPRTEPNSRFPSIRVEAAVLRALRSLKPGAWISYKQVNPTIDGAGEHQVKSAVRRLADRQLIQTRRIKDSNAHEMCLTAAGRRLAKKAQPDKALAKVAPTPVAPAEMKLAILRYIAQQTQPAYGPDIYRIIEGKPGAIKQALIAVRGEGLVEMTGTRNRARYTLTRKGKAKAHKKGAPAAVAASAPGEQRAARRLRRSQAGRRRHRR